jgi:hypothetical protein
MFAVPAARDLQDPVDHARFVNDGIDDVVNEPGCCVQWLEPGAVHRIGMMPAEQVPFLLVGIQVVVDVVPGLIQALLRLHEAVFLAGAVELVEDVPWLPELGGPQLRPIRGQAAEHVGDPLTSQVGDALDVIQVVQGAVGVVCGLAAFRRLGLVLPAEDQMDALGHLGPERLGLARQHVHETGGVFVRPGDRHRRDERLQQPRPLRRGRDHRQVRQVSRAGKRARLPAVEVGQQVIQPGQAVAQLLGAVRRGRLLGEFPDHVMEANADITEPPRGPGLLLGRQFGQRLNQAVQRAELQA